MSAFMQPNPVGEKKRGMGAGKLPKFMSFFSGKKKYKTVAQKQVEALVFLNFIPAFPGLLNVLIQAFYFIYLSAK